MRLAVLSGLAMWVGVTLLLSRRHWFSRPPLVERLRPYAPGGMSPSTQRDGVLSVDSFREVIGPLARVGGARLARLFGVEEDLARRLARVHASVDVTGFRVRQLGWAVGGFAAGGVVALLVPVPPAVGVLFILGAPLLAFLALEQQAARASATWQRHLFLELPVIAEQLGMLLTAGYSLGAALNRMAARGHGACARDLKRVVGRIRHGLSEIESLQEWAELADVPELRRLVHVLGLNRTTADLGTLIAQEARSIRQEVQRRRMEQIERRSQQVWIPVTVATLVPGVIFLVIPFIEALRLFTGS